MSKITSVLLSACFFGVTIVLPTAVLAEGGDYDLMVMHKFEDGSLAEVPFNLAIDFFDCLQAKKKVQIGRKFPRGLLIGADGRSLGGTIIGARCVQRIPKMGQ